MTCDRIKPSCLQARWFQSVALLSLMASVGGCAQMQQWLPAQTTPTASGPSVPVRFSPIIHALGTEPFWSLDINVREGRFKTPENPAGTALQLNWEVTPHQVVYVGHDAQRVALRLQLQHRPCSDGMSDRRYAMTAQLHYGSKQYQGCAWAP